MPDFPTSRPVLAGKSSIKGAQAALEALPEGYLLQFIGSTTREALEQHLSAAGLGDASLRAAGYRQWFAVGDRQLSSATVRGISDALPAGTFLSDQSHGRVRLRLSGPRAAECLAKGTAIDLHPNVFPEGQSAITLFNHISVLLTRTGPEAFELAVLRSFAESLHETLLHG